MAVLTARYISRINGELAHMSPALDAMTAGFRRARLVAAIIAALGALTTLRTANVRGEEAAPAVEPRAESVAV
ncbi:MAG: major facilitator superfamily multidrug resistance protein [Nocardia sp.]|uniref:hypothetical protein n=1 Tax=Nocardia sp. TaxID=1821 RepID=UPI00261CDE19|nr:hypothetical protein [Nocardia sp.]MCU1644915.1 major facilitator superfamily multidrug resistance protein [Nocardia sp.]